MSQEDKPASVRRPTIDDHLNTFARACAFGDVEALRYAADAIKAMVQSQPVAAQEPVFAFRRKGQESFCTCNEDRYNELAQKPNLFEVTKFYANAAPCARCAELEREKFDWKKEFGEDRAENIELQAKITEQAARIGELEAREAILVRSNSSLNAQRAENASLKEVISLSEDSRLMDEYLKLERANARQAERIKEQAAEIDHQRKGIELAKTALEKSVERDIKQWHNADIEGDDDDKPPEKLGDEVIQEQLKALAAIAELEKGVG